MKTRRFVLPILILVIGGALVSACAGHLSVKQNATAALRTVDTALSSAQDFERANVAALHLDTPAAANLIALCVPLSADGTPAPAPTKHQVIACLLQKAFTDEARAARALETYQPGQPVPATLTALQADVDTGLAAAKIVAPDRADFLATVQAVVDAVLRVINQVAVAVAPAKTGA
jgi:hypothetical protein